MAIIRKSNDADYTFEAGSIKHLRVVSFSGGEGISELFSFSLELASKNAEIKFETVLGKNALLTIFYPEGKRYVNGIINRFEETGKGERFTRYQAEIVPAVWLLSNRYKSKIFQEMTIPDIIKKILSDGDIPSDQFEFSLKGSYQPREYCVQYRETDLNFISRLMEEEGIFYFFKHEEKKHVMVIADDMGLHPSISKPDTILYKKITTAEVSSEEHIYDYQFTQEIKSGVIALRDYDFKKPRLNMDAQAKARGNGKGEVYDSPGKYINPDTGKALAKVRLEEIHSTKKIARGKSDCRRLIPGFRFKIDRHYRSEFNREYTLTRVNHWGAQQQVLEEEADAASDKEPLYNNDFDSIPSDIQFRPIRITEKPIVHGGQTALVVGPKGEEIYTDEYGRVKVEFHWDREGKEDEKSSCWVRVSQGWAGAGWGMIFIPRIGQEVVVNFLEGNPDNPIITGCVYNGDNPVPYPLPEEKTKSTIKSNTSTGGGGFNEIRFEDKSGGEEVFIHGQKDLNIEIENDKKQTIGHDETLEVANNRTKTVGKDQSETISENKTISVGKNHTESISENMSLTIGKNLSENINDNSDLTIGKDFTSSIGENSNSQIGKDLGMNIGKKMNIQAGDQINIISDKQIVLKAGDASITLKQSGDIIISGGKISIKASGDLIMKGSKITSN